MAMKILFILASLYCVFTMVNCRFVLYDSDNSDTKVDVVSHFDEVKKMLNNILSKVNAINEQESENASECDDDWFKHRDSCYFVISKKIGFKSAEDECRQLNAHVVRLETKEENEFLKSYMDNHDIKTYWIGITDVEKEGVWKLSGTDRIVQYTDWKGDEPNNVGGKEDCAVIHRQTQWFGWVDIPCERSYPAICERQR